MLRRRDFGYRASPLTDLVPNPYKRLNIFVKEFTGVVSDYKSKEFDWHNAYIHSPNDDAVNRAQILNYHRVGHVLIEIPNDELVSFKCY